MSFYTLNKIVMVIFGIVLIGATWFMLVDTAADKQRKTRRAFEKGLESKLDQVARELEAQFEEQEDLHEEWKRSMPNGLELP